MLIVDRLNTVCLFKEFSYINEKVELRTLLNFLSSKPTFYLIKFLS